MRWVLRCDVATERLTRTHHNAVGTGHLIRCLAFAEELRSRGANEVRIVVGGDLAAVAELANTLDITPLFPAGELQQIRALSPDAIAVDINYLAVHRIEALKSCAPVVNLAPRGEPKYFADVTVNNTSVIDEPCPPGGRLENWFRGPRYAIVRRDFTDGTELERADDRVLIAFGGVDDANLTSRALEELLPLAGDLHLDVVIGRLNPQIQQVRQLFADLGFRGTVHVQPTNFPEMMRRTGVAVLGMGTTVDEALTVGTPVIGVGLTHYHALRAKELRDLGMIEYAELPCTAHSASLVEVVQLLLENQTRCSQMRSASNEIFDGRGVERAVTASLRVLSG